MLLYTCLINFLRKIITKISHIYLGVINFFRFKSQLKQCLLYDRLNAALNIDFSIGRLIDLDLGSLKKNNIEALILDYDGVLSCYGERQPTPEVLIWLQQAITIFGSNKIFILSNNPSLIRKQFIDQYFEGKIIFIISKPKPDPEGIFKIVQYLSNNYTQLSNQKNLLLIDDRLGTGILGAKIFGIASCLILKPYISIKQNFLIESLFILLRSLERFIVWHL